MSGHAVVDQVKIMERDREIERLGKIILEHEDCERKQELEIERLRDAIAQKCRQYDADMKTMQGALNREIEARQTVEARNAELLAVLDACAIPTPGQCEEMETGFGAIFTPRAALERGMKTAIGNVRRAIAEAKGK